MAIINAGPAERRNDLNLYLTAFFFALLRMVILSAKCHANQCETFRRATVLQREVTERAKEQRRQHAADEEQKRADEELAKIQADADAAERARGGLQQQLAAVQRQLAGSETGRLSALAAASQAKAETGILLAQLLGEADDLAGKFAKEADERYVAGSTCERTWDKVTGQN